MELGVVAVPVAAAEVEVETPAKSMSIITERMNLSWIKQTILVK